ncbi:hypothetical protein DL96DRAFT_1594602 [Flagelloscypha sp. PMI_526]|nr:hypothetical protein DL96DRAFT_1594602 [Flagelloscypha sp. PMI_526]
MAFAITRRSSSSTFLSRSLGTGPYKKKSLEEHQLGLPRWKRRALLAGHSEEDVLANAPHTVPKSRKAALGLPTAKEEKPYRIVNKANKEKAKAEGKALRKAALPPTETKLLQPVVLVRRLTRLYESGKLDSAIEMLKNSPLDAQNPPVWNTVIWFCLKEGRYSVAYKLYVDMKRRGFSPTTRTYHTLLSGFSRIESWEQHHKQLTNVHSIYEAYVRHITSLSRHEPDSPQLDPGPIAFYLKILSRTKQYKELLAAFSSIPEGALYRVGGDLREIGSLDPKTNNITASFVWEEAVKASASKNHGFELDSHLVANAILALSQGRPQDKELAFDLARQFYGLVEPNQPAVKGSMALEAPALSAVLTLCNTSERYRTCIHFFESLQRSKKNLTVFDSGHIEQVLIAYREILSLPPDLTAIRARLLGKDLDSTPARITAKDALTLLKWTMYHEIVGATGGKLRPKLTTYHLALQCCWRDQDWITAAHLFDLMTGYHCHDFADGVEAPNPRRDQRSPGRGIEPTGETISMMVRIAVSTENPANIRQSLRLAEKIGLSAFLTDATSRKQAKKVAFYTEHAYDQQIIASKRSVAGAPKRSDSGELEGLVPSGKDKRMEGRSTTRDLIVYSSPSDEDPGFASPKQGHRRAEKAAQAGSSAKHRETRSFSRTRDFSDSPRRASRKDTTAPE